MSYPERNPDTRPLPEGWTTQYDPTYQTWFYIDTRQNPPRPSWEHPLGPPPPVNYVPPSGPPSKSPNNPQPPPSYAQGWEDNRGSSPYGQPSPYQQPQQSYYPQQQQVPHANGKPEPTSRGMGGLIGKLLGGHGSHGSSHGGYSGGYGGGYAQQQPNLAYVQGKPKRHGMGMGGVALAGGAGLVGGMLVADAIDDYGDNRYDQGFGAGEDYGGGDFDGGFDF